MGILAELAAGAGELEGLGELFEGIFSTTLASTAIESVSYDIEEEELTITFVKGGSYVFYSVPRSVVVGLVTAASPGGYYNSVIRGVYV